MLNQTKQCVPKDNKRICIQGLVVALAFFIPISTSLTSILMILVLLGWLLTGHYQEKWRHYFSNPLTNCLCALILLSAVGLIYTSATLEQGLETFKDYIRLAFIPVLMYYLHEKGMQRKVVLAFTFAMVITLILGYLKIYAHLPIGEKYTMGAVFKSHIKTSYFMAIALFIISLSWLSNPRRGWLILLAAMMLHYLFFLSFGRIGHLTVLILGILMAWHFKKAKGLAIGAVCLCFLFLAFYFTSDTFSARINLLKKDWAIYQQDGRLVQSSLGSRLTFYQTGFLLFTKKPILGEGTGGFENAYQFYYQDKNTLLTDNPHNQYIKVMVEFGIVGLFILLYLFYQQWRIALTFENGRRLMVQGCLLTFYIGCFLNSWISDFTEGYFFILFSAVAFSGATLKQPMTYFSAPKIVKNTS